MTPWSHRGAEVPFAAGGTSGGSLDDLYDRTLSLATSAARDAVNSESFGGLLANHSLRTVAEVGGHAFRDGPTGRRGRGGWRAELTPPLPCLAPPQATAASERNTRPVDESGGLAAVLAGEIEVLAALMYEKGWALLRALAGRDLTGAHQAHDTKTVSLYELYRLKAEEATGYLSSVAAHRLELAAALDIAGEELVTGSVFGGLQDVIAGEFRAAEQVGTSCFPRKLMGNEGGKRQRDGRRGAKGMPKTRDCKGETTVLGGPCTGRQCFVAEASRPIWL